MKKFLKFVACLLILLTVAVYFGGGMIVEHYSRQFLGRVPEAVAETGVQLEGLNFVSAKVTGPMTATWYGVKASVKVKADGMINRAREFEVEADSVSVSPIDFLFKAVLFDVRNLTLKTKGEALLADVAGEGAIRGERISGDLLQIILPVSPPDPAPTIKFVKHTIKNLLKNGTIESDFEFEGKIDIYAAKDGSATAPIEVVPVRLRTQLQGRTRSVVLDRHDLALLAERFDDQLTDGEITFVAQHPLQAPLLMGIRHRAEVVAKEALAGGQLAKTEEKSSEEGVVGERRGPYDAFRYVLWSYLLTKALDAQFAEAVTDAHEDRGDQGDDERRMDLNNAKVGRAYAKRGVAEKDILKLVLTDPDVIREIQ